MKAHRKSLIEEYGEEKGNLIADLIVGKKNPDDFASVEAWIRQCYHRPSRQQQVLCAIDEILETFGVEGLPGLDVSYCNTGDTYAPTIMLNENGTFIISSWGDFVERYERRHGRLP